jgi:hypothetical protein
MLLLPIISDAPKAEVDLGKIAVANAMADPLTVTLKKSLLVFIGISSLSFWVGWRPEIVRQVHNDRLWRTSHNHPSEWMLLRRIKFLMWQPTRHMQKIARLNSGRVFPEVAPSHTSLSFKDIDNRVLFAVVVNAGLR